jgi:uncharacterized protein YgbK (DUF1537 family)
MPPNVTVIADDLTGACEIAGRGLAHGLTAVVNLDSTFPNPDVDLMVIDSDSRLQPEAIAESTVEAIAAQLPMRPDSRLFKKTDSVLRGSVHAEIAALLSASQKRSALLVPANPDLGRGISDGIYTIRDKPLSETEFADDPHHPVTDSNVLHLLQGSRLTVRSVRNSTHPSAAEGELLVGDAMTHTDLRNWAEAVTPDILPAGSAAFFSALLERWFPRSSEQDRKDAGTAPLPSAGLTLLVSGTRAPAQRTLLNQVEAAGGPVVSLDGTRLDSHALAQAAEQADQCFRTSSTAIIRVREGSGNASGETARSILAALAELTASLLSRQPLTHIAIEGGATAAAICKRLGYVRLSVLREWSPGTVLVKPLQNESAPAVTVKPGSYPWPEAIHKTLFADYTHAPAT